VSALLLAEHTRVECRALAAAGAVVVLPIGATEQHGPHLPVGTDNLQVEHVVLQAAARAAAGVPVLVAPTLPYGCSPHHVPFGGTASLSSETFLRVLVELGTALAQSGFTRLALVNGHGGNHQLTSVAARDLALAHDIDVAACSWWHVAAEAAVAAGALERGRVPGHAGAFETSCILALRADLVAEELPHRDPAANSVAYRDPLQLELHGSWGAIDGYSDSPANGEAEHGRTYLELGADAVADAIRRLVAASPRRSGSLAT
jgi:creatinine amidohydrolase